jgi:hypothetical protein
MSWEVVNALETNITTFVILVQAAYTFRGRRLKPLENLTLLILKQEELNRKAIKKARNSASSASGPLIVF